MQDNIFPLTRKAFFGSGFVSHYVSYFETNNSYTSSPTIGSTTDIIRIYLFYSEVAKTILHSDQNPEKDDIPTENH